MKKVYMCIDLKTFFASVECSERKLDPFKTNLVVADPSRGKGALCLARNFQLTPFAVTIVASYIVVCLDITKSQLRPI